jgi:electron transport complex protein RnfG
MNAPPPAAPASGLRMIATLGTVALVSGILVVSAYQLSLPQILQNRRIATERALNKAIPNAATRKTYIVGAHGLIPTDDPAPEGTVIYAAYDASGALLGIAAEGSARGYQDVLRVLYAYSPSCQCINGYYILHNNDTPGIGDQVSKDPVFLANFRHLDARLNDDRSALRNRIVTVKHGSKKENWQIDAVSGATISSKAVGRAINDSAQTIVPAVHARLDSLVLKPASRQ